MYVIIAYIYIEHLLEILTYINSQSSKQSCEIGMVSLLSSYYVGTPRISPFSVT